jgi:hypothetical protein
VSSVKPAGIADFILWVSSGLSRLATAAKAILLGPVLNMISDLTHESINFTAVDSSSSEITNSFSLKCAKNPSKDR